MPGTGRPQARETARKLFETAKRDWKLKNTDFTWSKRKLAETRRLCQRSSGYCKETALTGRKLLVEQTETEFQLCFQCALASSSQFPLGIPGNITFFTGFRAEMSFVVSARLTHFQGTGFFFCRLLFAAHSADSKITQKKVRSSPAGHSRRGA